MNSYSPSAFLLSATLHATVALVLLFTAYVFKPKPPENQLFELVAGDGVNYMAKEAPALGDEGVKFSAPKVPAPPVLPPVTPPPQAPVTPPESPKAEPAPMTPAPPPAEKQEAPKPLPPPKKTVAPKEPPSFSKQLADKLRAAKNKAKNQVKKEREAEEKQRLTKEAFDKAQEAKKVASAKTPSPNVKKINTAGIKEGVTGGSTANTVGGARGNALVADDGSEAQRYEALLMQLLREQLDQTPGLEDGLKAEAELHLLADGTLTRARIVNSSGNAVFDRAVLRAIAAVKMPKRPERFQELLTIPFSTRAKD